jgi:predicted ATP-dependent endonuclease of OLD family
LLNVLTTSLIDSARSQTIDRWRKGHETALTELRSSTREAVHSAIESRSNSINASLSRYVNRSKVVLEASDPDVEVRYPTTITASISGSNGTTLPVSNEGHGLQRAVAMSMIEALHADEVSTDEATKTIILAAEEPEIYQHPVRARAFAQSLKVLAENAGFQVAIATHSPAFVSYQFMESLRFTRMLNGTTCVKYSSVSHLADIQGKHVETTREWLSKEVPKSFTEAFFADLVVLVEGPTDEALIPELANLLGIPFEHRGIVSVAAESKSSLAQYNMLLAAFGRPHVRDLRRRLLR